MREIKFRGKRIDNGEWVYGYYWNNELGNVFIKVSTEIINNKTEIFVLKDYEVDKKTVGQYTGLKDSDGTKIYEDDFVLCGDRLIRQILFSEDEASFKASGLNTNGYNEPLYMNENNFKVVGNIHD